MTRAPAADRSLWWIAVPPGIWAVHFLLSYGTVAIACAKAADRAQSFSPMRMAVIVYSVVALTGLVVLGWRGYEEYVRETGALSDDTPESRSRFMGFATFLLSALSAVAVLLAVLVPLFFRSCL